MTITLKDGTAYGIEEGASINNIPIGIGTVDEVPGILATFSDENLTEVRLAGDFGQTIHYNLHMVSASVNTDRSLLTVFLTERDETALRLDELDAAIVELAGMIAGEE